MVKQPPRTFLSNMPLLDGDVTAIANVHADGSGICCDRLESQRLAQRNSYRNRLAATPDNDPFERHRGDWLAESA
jgi:hypothetical protein